ncbi:MAG TPA: 16S rRNA (cytosine(1402)-N(4))-methyltransferase RsmH [Candidatus Solibacter sp.]|nr:16S rRNA (cytosine(1402)-N(4))-methyltransferase RsmH [Candidatus Solibacter sp.]
MAEDDFGLDKAPQGAHGGTETVGHVPVLLKEAIDFLAIRRGGTYIDATLGLGGHSLEIAKRLGPRGHLIGFDKDPHALEAARKRLSQLVETEGEWPVITLLQGSYAEVGERIPAASADGLLADLGISSLQLGDPARGFSFQAEGPLDMRMDPYGERTADQVVNHMSEEDLANVIYEFGEERRSRRIARAIVRARPVRTTAHLAQVVSAALRPMNPSTRKGGVRWGTERIHPATRVFQAIRIFVNRELDDLKALLAAAPRVLKPGGRMVIISFHSLEDRIVKDATRLGAKTGIYELLVKKPVVATKEEMDRNPRSRSAKLRAVERTGERLSKSDAVSPIG